MRFRDMTYREIEAFDRKYPVVIPLGSCEQHGPHLPVNTDTLLVTAVAEALEQRALMLLTDTIPFGHSPHHVSFGGTVSVEHTLYSQLLVQLAENVHRMGFRRLLFLNGHGGNRLPVQIALQELKNRFPDLLACGCDYWQVAREEIAAIRESGPGGMGHAGELETALCMYLAPDSVRYDKLADAGTISEKPYFRSEMFLSGTVMAVGNFDEFTPTGVFGAPSVATAENGKRFFEAIVNSMQEFLEHFTAADSFWSGGRQSNT